MKKSYLFRLALLLFAVTLGQSVKAQTFSGGTGTETDPYQIASLNDWNTLADAVEQDNEFSGKFFKLTANIGTITKTIGYQVEGDSGNNQVDMANRKRFAGIFDGDGHTITVNLTSSAINPNYTAPFAFVKNATIKNLKVAGKIVTTGQFASGLVGSSGNKSELNINDADITIENCEVAVDLECHYLSDANRYSNQAGFIGVAEGKATISNCVFSGILSGADFAYSGGFIGQTKKPDNKLTNCFFVPSAITARNIYGSSEFVHKLGSGSYTLNNCYYTKSFSDDPNLAQGTKVVTTLPANNMVEGENNDYITVTDLNNNNYYVVYSNPNWVAIQTAMDSNSEDSYTLLGDVTAGSKNIGLVVPANKTFYLNLNGYTLDRALDIVAARNDGYVIKVEAGGYLTIYDGTIRGGHNTGNGGGIYNAGTLNLDGVTVTGNYASKGAGVYHEGNIFTIGGNVQINGNHNDNVYLPDGKVIFVTGNINASTSIGVTMAVPGEQGQENVFTSNLHGTNVTSAIFFSDNPNYFVDTTTGLYPDAFLNGQFGSLTLYDNQDNTTAIAALNGKGAAVTLSGRTFKAKVWNTLCLPFDVTFEQLKTVLGNNIKVNELDPDNSSFVDGYLALYFAPLFNNSDVIKAGTPFVVKVSNKSEDVTFTGVTVKSGLHDVEGNGVKFIGTYAPFDFPANDQSYRFLSNNKLYYPSKNNKVNALRGYFKLTNGNSVKAIDLFFGDDDDATPTVLVDEIEKVDNSWYDMSGRKLSGKPAQKGIYVNNGKKIIIK